MSEEKVELPAERSSVKKEEPLFTEKRLEALLGYERFEAAEFEAIPKTGLNEEERSDAIRDAQIRARISHKIFYNNFLSQVFPDADDNLSRLVFFCDEGFHEGNPVEISSIKFYEDEETGLINVFEGMTLTPFYQETFLLNDKPMNMSLSRARSMGFDFGLGGGLRVHSTFACTCQLKVEIRTEKLNSFFRLIFDTAKREGLIHNRELRFPLKGLSVLISSR